MASTPRLTRATARRRLAVCLGLGLLVALLLLGLRHTGLFASLELPLVDLRTRFFADERSPDPRIVLVQIGERDVDDVNRQLGVRWPWPLEYDAHLVRVLHEAGARALMVDILHLDRGAGPDDVPGSEALPDAARQLRQIEAGGADEYGAALKAFGRAAVAFELSDDPRYDIPARRGVAEQRLGGDAWMFHAATVVRSGAELPVRRVAEGAARLGFSNTPTDRDGIVRRPALQGLWGKRAVLSLPLATAALAVERGVSDDKSVLHVGDVSQRLPGPATFLVNFQRRAYARVAAGQILGWALRWEAEGTLPAEARTALQGKIVVFGVNLAGLKDVVASPLGGTMDGPVYQATVLDNLLHGDGRVVAPAGTNARWLFVLALLVGLVGGVRLGRGLAHLVPLVIMALFTWLVFARFRAGVSLDLFTPLFAVLLTWGSTTAWRALTAGRRNRWLEGTFGRYMAPSIIAALKRDPRLLELGGRKRTVAVLFSDVAGFTGLSARLQPDQVVHLLNRYLTGHCKAVIDAGGVVDKFEGDAVMAFFGDPVPQPDHALRACRAALRVQRDLPRLQPLLDELGVPEFAVRIGVNTGEAVVGNMGSAQRFDYTCMGDTVNVASRLEGAGKAFGAHILVGASTARAVAEDLVCRSLGDVVVVGREEPVAVYELLAERADAPADLLAHVAAFDAALAAAREGDLTAARKALAEAARLRADDGPTVWFAGVLGDLEREVPGAWNGVTVLGAK